MRTIILVAAACLLASTATAAPATHAASGDNTKAASGDNTKAKSGDNTKTEAELGAEAKLNRVPNDRKLMKVGGPHEHDGAKPDPRTPTPKK